MGAARGKTKGMGEVASQEWCHPGPACAQKQSQGPLGHAGDPGSLHGTSAQQLRQAARKVHQHMTTTDTAAEPSPLPVTTQDTG